MASLTSAPAFRRTRTTSVRPSRTAKNSGIEPGRQCLTEIGSGLQKRVDHVRMPLGRGPHQGCLPAPFLGVDVGPASKKRLHRSELSGPRGGHQDRLVAAELRVRIGAGFQKQKNHASLPLMQASESGVTPYRFAALTSALASTRSLAISRSS